MTKPCVLMVAYHFPPLTGSSGLQRTLRFVQHLPRYGWEPLVLTTTENAYEKKSGDQLAAIPQGTVVRRAFALDAGRHLAVGGHYLRAMATPDRWVSWRFDGVRHGLKLIREFQPSAVWSTFPFPTAHLIGEELARRTGLPWIADFRDPMAQPDYPSSRYMREKFEAIEAKVVERAALCVFTAPGAAEACRKRYPNAASRIIVIENGYDDASFLDASSTGVKQTLAPGCITVLHSGIVYPSERDPTHFMQALRRLHDSKRIQPGQLKIRFRASSIEGFLYSLAAENNVLPYVECMPPLSYRDALAEMLQADALLVLQASNCNQQIPAKLYEYFRSGRPIVCLSDPDGDTCESLRKAGVTRMAPLGDIRAIESIFVEVLDRARSGDWLGFLPEKSAVSSASREGRTQELAAALERITQSHRAAKHKVC